jgi:hypothetical protein
MKNPIRASFVPATRIALAAGIVAAFGASAGVASAGAATGCAGLQAALEHAGSGATVVLDGMCTGSYTLPPNATFTLEGAPGTTSGFEGNGASVKPLLGNLASTEAGAMTLSHLTFEHANLKEASALSILASRVTLSDDSFLDNEEHGESAHAAFISVGATPSSCPSPAGTTAITLTGSTFSGNKLDLEAGRGGGAGAWLEDDCKAGGVLEDNVFEGNLLEAAGTPTEVVVSGAGLQFVGPSRTRPEPVVSQRGNVFDSDNIVAAAPAEADYGGGGEWLEYASLRSIDDRFSRDSVPGTAPTSQAYVWSWGGGLGIWTPEEECDATAYPHPESTLEDAIVEGDSIGPGTPEDIGGGGVYVGCSHLNVLDSTVTLNTAYNGAGIEGESGDQLVLANSIVAEGSGANEIAGFEEAYGGSLKASFSDVCASADSSEPLPGAGDICTDPLLADDGDPASFDVHETSSSPTIDAGSNALVPTELTTDAYGTPRILTGRTGCTGSFPATVDMGATEFVPSAPPSCPAPTQAQAPAPIVQQQTPAAPQAHFVSLKLSSTGIGLRLSCGSSDGRGCSGTIYITSDETLKGKKVVAVGTSNRDKKSVRLGQASFSLAAGTTATFPVKLNATGLELLRQFHAFSASVLANEALPSNSQVVFFLHDARFSVPNERRKAKRLGP